MNGPSLDGLKKLFSFEKKKDLERYCRDLTISSDEFVALVLACNSTGQPFLHEISCRDKIPPHLVPTDPEIEALTSTPAGTFLSGDAAKAASKMSQSFVERRYLVGHMFFTPDYAQWHFFCFDQRDLETSDNHWKFGSHVHFVNWLWPGQNPKSILSDFVTEEERAGGAIHLRFVEPTQEACMDIKQCEFDAPVEKRSSTGIYEGMFNENVGFRFEVEIDSTKRKHVEEMLNRFEKMANDFKETWQTKLASIR